MKKKEERNFADVLHQALIHPDWLVLENELNKIKDACEAIREHSENLTNDLDISPDHLPLSFIFLGKIGAHSLEAVFGTHQVLLGQLEAKKYELVRRAEHQAMIEGLLENGTKNE